jgi:predicted RNA-binding Zn-ribbon protein involved in translation (DUF1610 family)
VQHPCGFDKNRAMRTEADGVSRKLRDGCGYCPRYDGGMARKAPEFDLSTRCTECGYAIEPRERLKTGWDTMRCPQCGKDFIPERKGNGSLIPVSRRPGSVLAGESIRD